MEVFDLNNIPSITSPVVTIGKFDGVHIAHKKLLKTLVDKAKTLNGKSVVITFDIHPVSLSKKKAADFFLILDTDEIIEKIADTGVDYLLLLNVNKHLLDTNYETFIDDILFQKLKTNTLLLGYNNAIGKNREGSVQNIQAVCEKLKINIDIFPENTFANYNVSSTLIRHSILAGEIELANQLLGYDYRITGTIKNNVFVPHNDQKIIPAYGMYQVNINSDDLNMSVNCNVGEKIELYDIDNFNCEDINITFLRKID